MKLTLTPFLPLFFVASAHANLPVEPCALDAAKTAVVKQASVIIHKMSVSELEASSDIAMRVPSVHHVELKSTVTNAAGGKDYVYSVVLGAGAETPTFTVVTREVGGKGRARCKIIGADNDADHH